MIYLAKVVSKAHESESDKGIFWCFIESHQLGPIPVRYTSPYYATYYGGIFAMPEAGTEVLIFLDEPKNTYYYLSNVVNPKPNSDILEAYAKKLPASMKAIVDKYIYTENSIPQRMTFTDYTQQGLIIDSRTLENYVSTKVQLISSGGKRLNLSDSPKSNLISLKTEHGDGLVITSKPIGTKRPRKDSPYPLRAIELKSNGSNSVVSYESEINLLVIDGREINIENNSSTKLGDSGGTKSGNINIKSKNSDVNIVTNGDTSKIFIVTPKARIQIDSEGNVVFETSGSIQMASQGDIALKANNSIYLEANSINMKSNQATKIQSGAKTSIKSGGQTAIQGSEVHLNSAPADSAETKNLIEVEKTDYDE